MEKICTLCLETKDVLEFSVLRTKGGILNARCKSCVNDISKKRYYGNIEYERARLNAAKAKGAKVSRKFLADYLKSHPCVDCGLTDIRLLEFDHVDSASKVNGVARLAMMGYSIAKVQKEIDKCEVRCRNCHTLKTYERAGKTWHDEYLTAD